ncbi:MAG: DUF4845 domain-containing protein [Pseudomonadota bacterium]
MINRAQQGGATLVGMLLWGIIIVFVALLAMKLIPAYVEFMTVDKILSDLGSEEGIGSMSNSEIRDHFTRRAMIDNIDTVKASDLRISREGGKTVITVDYTFRTPLIANISLLAEFSASSDSRESKVAQKLAE